MATVNTARLGKVLYFVDGMVPTEKEKQDAARHGNNVGIRNAQAVGEFPMDSLEACDYVAGPAVPARYAAAYPNAASADEIADKLSDYDLPHGAVTDPNNERARAAKPPAVNQDPRVAADGPRPAGAVTQRHGGFVAPQPGLSPELMAEGTRTNPAGLPAGGATVAPTNAPEPAVTTGTAQTSEGGFTKPAEAAKPEGKAKAADKGK